MRTSTRIVLAASLAAAFTAQSQPVEIRILVTAGQDAPGVDGPYTLASTPTLVRVDEDGSVAFIGQLLQPGQPSGAGAFLARPGEPLMNVADDVTDIAMTEVGPDDITSIVAGDIFATSNEGLRFNDDGTLSFYATTARAVVTPSGIGSNVVTLGGDGTAVPVVVARKDRGTVNTGDPLAIWHELERSPSGAQGLLRFRHPDAPSQIREIVGDSVGPLIVQSGDDAVLGVAAPSDWLDWSIDLFRRPVVGDSGRTALVARFLDSGGGTVAEEGVVTGLPGVSRAPLYDPRSPGAAFPGIPAGSEVDRLEVKGLTSDDATIVFGRVSGLTNGFGDGLWSIDQSGVGTPLLVEDTPAPEMDPGDIVRNVQTRRVPGGRVSVGVVVGNNRSAVYTVENDGGFGLRLRTGAPVLIPGRPGGPFTLFGAGMAPFMTDDGRMLFTGLFSDAGGQLGGAAFYTDAAGNLRTVFVSDDDFDFDPDAPGGEAPAFVRLIEMNATGDAVARFASSVTGDSALVTFSIDPTPCPSDTNNDGLITPADFNAWIVAFNNGTPECDQNGDTLCTPADFNAWILNYNNGC